MIRKTLLTPKERRAVELRSSILAAMVEGIQLARAGKYTKHYDVASFVLRSLQLNGFKIDRKDG